MGRKDKPIETDLLQNSYIGAQLRHHRQTSSVSLTEMARRLGYTKGYLSGVENGTSRVSSELIERYKKELKLRSEELSFPAPPSQEVLIEEQPWNVPYQRNPLFTGRDKILEDLHKRLIGTKKAPVLALTGLGGIGKTQVALEYAYRFRTSYKGIFWLKADTSEVLMSEFTNAANILTPPRSNIDEFKRWLRETSSCLLIIDSLDHPDDLAATARLLSRLGDTRVVITTRLQGVGALAQTLELGKMETDEGTLFLLRRISALSADASPNDAPEAVYAQAKAIATAMDGLPLALDQAGSYIEETGCNLAHYFALFAQQQARLLRERGKFAVDHPASVAATWSLAFAEIQQTNAGAADLLYLCAFLQPDSIPKDILLEGASALGPTLRNVAVDLIALDQCIGDLRKYSLVQRNPETEVLTIHRLLQSVVKDTMTAEMQHLWAERAVRAINSVFPRIETTTWMEGREKGRKYFAHAQICIELIKQWDMKFSEAARLLSNFGKYAEEVSAFDIAEQSYLSAFKQDEQREGVEIDQIMGDLNDLALFYQRRKKYRQAEFYYKEAIKIQERQTEAEFPSASMTEIFRNYAAFLREIERENEAVMWKKRVVHHPLKEVIHTTINDDNPEIIYDGSWIPKSGEGYNLLNGDYGGDVHLATVEGASFQYSFTGVGAAILSDTQRAQGTIEIYLDGSYVQTVSTSHVQDQQSQTVIFHITNLQLEPHTLKGQLIHGSFILDALVIFHCDED